MGVRERLVRTIINVLLFRLTSFGALRLLFSHTVNSRAWIDIIVDSPIGSLASVGERTWDFLEAWVERKIMSDRILKYSMISFVLFCRGSNKYEHNQTSTSRSRRGYAKTRRRIETIDHIGKVLLTFQPEGAVLKYGN